MVVVMQRNVVICIHLLIEGSKNEIHFQLSKFIPVKSVFSFGEANGR
jgi:hypothetical protein